MLKEPKRFSAKHWWNVVTLVLAAAGLVLWRMGLVDGRIVVGGLIAWALLGLAFAPALVNEHLAFADRWIFHDYAKAHVRYRKAVDTKKATPQGYCALASLAYAEGDLGEAARLLEEASHRLPADAHLHFLLSRVLSKQQRHEEALAEAIRAGKMANGGILGDVALGDALAAKGDTLSAASAYQKVVAKKPDLTHGRLGLAKCYLAEGHVEAARSETEEALRLAPSNSDALYWAGKVANAQNRLYDATQLLQSALDLRPIDDQARLVPYQDLVTSLCEVRENMPYPPIHGTLPSGHHFDRT